MSHSSEREAGAAGILASIPQRRMRGTLVLATGFLALAAPFFAGPLTLFLVGWLLIVCGSLEFLSVFQAIDASTRRSAYLGGMLSIGGGILLLSEPRWVVGGLSVLVALTFLIDGIGKCVAAWSARSDGRGWGWTLGSGVVYFSLAFVLLTGWPFSGLAVVGWVVGCHMLATGWAMVLDRAEAPQAAPASVLPSETMHPDAGLSLPADPEFAALHAATKLRDEGRRAIDAYWCWIFVMLFFAIHMGRMNVSWNLVGMVSPLVAVVADVATALILAFGLILPTRVGWRRLTRPLERHGWQRLLAHKPPGKGAGSLGRLSRGWLLSRYRFSRTVMDIFQSPRAALRWGLQVGLPATALLIAVNPIWGLNWFFNSESWATGVWDHWAAARTDHWRAQMIEAVTSAYPRTPPDQLFKIEPPDLAAPADFTFLVLGDTGEGGSAQHSLRDQYLALGARPDVKFLVISSDVIYPSGAMADYEPKFHLPFKGFQKPIYAIPGNHDWYDALEGFNANFLEPAAARASMLARIETDGRLTSTTERHIDDLIRKAARLRQEYGTRTGYQRGPFFEIQTEHFALLAVDTGVMREVDSKQWQWLKDALARSRGKFTMAILGHPLYAGGRYQGGNDPLAGDGSMALKNAAVPAKDSEPFAAIHRLLKEARVRVVMAGDTHYFEHYLEKYSVGQDTRTMYHFVNGGGGAYISIGTPLDWPRQPAVPDCAFFPRTDAVVEKLDQATPSWKLPLWYWARYLRGWPLSAETLAGAFDYSRAPFFQSFVEVRVEGSRNRVRLIPHGANGPLRWREFDRFGNVMPADQRDDDFVEFIVPITASNS